MSESPVRTLRLEVPGEALSSVLFRLQSLNGRAHGLALPTWSDTVEPAGADAFVLTLTAGLPLLSGSTLLGTQGADGSLIPLPGGQPLHTGLPARVACTQCGTRRARQHFVFRDADGGLAAIGTPCLGDYLAGPDRAPLPARDAQDLVRLACLDPAQALQSTVASVGGSPRFDTNAVIALAMWLTDEHGYVNRTRSDRLGLRATADEMRAILGTDRTALPEEVSSRLLPAAVLRQWALDDMTRDSDFAERLAEAVARPTVTQHAFGLLSALPTAYRRASREEDARAAGDPIPGADYAEGYLAEPGTRLTVAGAYVEDARLLESGSTLLVLRGPSGHRLTWFASSAPRGGFPEPGSRVAVTGTVKANREFRGITDTVLTRCRFA